MSTDVHRNVCQLLFEEGVCSETALVEHLGDCIDRHKNEAKRARLRLTHDATKDTQTLKGVIDRVNGQLNPLGLMVARMKSRLSGEYELYYGLVNLNEEDGFGKQGWLSKSEQEFFHKIVDQILGSDQNHIEAVDAANMGRDLSATSKLSLSEAGKCLERLEHGQWLFKSDDGYYMLGVRTELQRRYFSSDDAHQRKGDAPDPATQDVD